MSTYGCRHKRFTHALPRSPVTPLLFDWSHQKKRLIELNHLVNGHVRVIRFKLYGLASMSLKRWRPGRMCSQRSSIDMARCGSILARFRELGMKMLINVVRGGREIHSYSCNIRILSCTGVRLSTPGTFRICRIDLRHVSLC